MSVHVICRVEIIELVHGAYRVVVDAGETGQCEVFAPGLAEALRCAMPFLYAAACPDVPDEIARLEAAFRAKSAQDGPPNE